MYSDVSRRRAGAATKRMIRSLAVLFPFSLAGNVLSQGVLAQPPGVQGAPPVPTMGNVIGSPGQAGQQLNTQPGGQLYGETPVQDNSQGNAQVKSEPNPENEAAGAEKVLTPINASLSSALQWGALHLRVRTSYQFLYATGVHTEPGKPTDTFTHTLTPGLTLELGPHVSLDYSPSLRIYSERDFHNTVDHSLSLTENFGYGDWTFGGVQLVSISDEPLIETSRQTRQTDCSASGTASYRVSDKTSLVTGAGINLVFVGNNTNAATGSVGSTTSELSDSQSYNVSEGLKYQFDQAISAGLIVALGYTEQNGGFTSFDDQYNGLVTWKPGKKLTVAISGGFQGMHFLNSKAPASYTPVYSGTIAYHVVEPTTLSLSASRAVGSSLYQNQTSDSTAIGVSVQQRLLGKAQLLVGFGYTKSDYTVVAVNLPTSRSDDGFSASVGVTVPFLKHFNFGTFYTFSQNTSSETGFGYSSSQVGVTLSWTQ